MSIFCKFISAIAIVGWSYGALAADYVEGEVIVKFKNSQNGSAAFASKATGSNLNLKRSWGKLNLHQFSVSGKAGAKSSVQQMLKSLQADPNVEFAEPNYILKKQSTGIEGGALSRNDVQSVRAQSQPQISGKVSAMSTESYYQSDAPIQVEDAWGILASNSYVPVVAVIDTGLDYNHDVFVDSGAVWTNPNEIPNNGIDDDNNGYIDDVHGWNFVANTNDPMDDEDHGTHVSGIILGMTQDIFASTISPAKIRIMPLKFLDSTGSGATSDGIEAIYYAINNGASVINASWGGGGFSQALQDAILEAYNNKMTFAAAAGNASTNNDSSPTYPANYSLSNIISIAATKDNDQMASFSNYGKQTVHVASPGVSILSTLPNNSYAYASGTSMATPMVAGIIALMEKQAGQPINGYQAAQIILGQNDSNVGNISGKVITDARVNAYKAVNYVKTSGVDEYQPASGVTASRSLASAAGGSAGGCGLVGKYFMDNNNSDGGSGNYFGRILLFLIILSPFVLAMALKHQRKEEEDRRIHQRYSITSEVRISVGDKELVGSVSSISLGGVKINTEALLEQGGIVEMNIMSPDGKEKVQVLGKVVWSQERKSYGVQFCDMAETQSSSITGWTKKLVKSS
ncbi:MAG: S8 family serine peptidase [Bdellovibrionaceae bacterium]|nr:S8 family serine peptidase [Pseudobdellovibrionaceae bacterium]